MRGSRLLLPASAILLVLASSPGSKAQEEPIEPKRVPSLLEGLPGGLLLIPEGDAIVGFNAETVARLLGEPWVKRIQAERDLVGSLGGERQRIPAFFMAAHEVTNGQYESFIKATGHRFPYHWWTEGDREKHAKLFQESSPTETFDPITYWEFNWQRLKLEWAMPIHPRTSAPMTQHPVEWVSYLDALAYCRWAGLRLPTEAEWIRAARGDTNKVYPWGADWEQGRKVNFFSSFSHPVDHVMNGEVSWPSGTIYHLAGNVMEWTASRYHPLPGFKEQNALLARRIPGFAGQVLPRWDGGQAIIKGGSYQLPDTAQVFSMIDARVPADTDLAMRSAGFRTCKSLWPGLDAFRVAVDLERAALGNLTVEADVEEETNFLGMEAWNLDNGTVRSYHSIGYAPIADQSEMSNVKALRDASIEEPVLIGVLFTTEPIEEPKLEPGLYLVYYRDDRPSPTLVAKARELREQQRRTKRGEEPEEPVEEIPDTDFFRLGDVKVPTRNRYLIFRDAETETWQPSLIRADVPDSRGTHIRATMEFNPKQEQILFQAPVRLQKRSAAIFKVRLTMPKGFLESREWRLPNQLSRNTFGYAKGWQRKLFQAGG